MIQKGYPDENIVFLTANDTDLDNFKTQCKRAFMKVPANTIGKSEKDISGIISGYPKMNRWLKEKVNDPYLTLRRNSVLGQNRKLLFH